MTTQQVESFSRTHLTCVVRVTSTLGDFSGRVGGVRFDAKQRRQCLRILEGPRVARMVPVHTIQALRGE